MARYVAAIDTVKALNRVLIVCLIVAFSVIAVLAVSLANESRDGTIYLPPDLTKGAHMDIDEHPPEQVFSFAWYIMSYINSWPNNGAKDYIKNITDVGYYLTPACSEQFHKDYEASASRSGINQLIGRRREITVNHDFPYAMDMVRQLPDGTWAVTLYTNLYEYIGSTNVKKRQLKYQLSVVESRSDPARNQFGLRLNCYIDEPLLITTE